MLHRELSWPLVLLDASRLPLVGTAKLCFVQAVATLGTVLGLAGITFPAPRPSLL